MSYRCRYRVLPSVGRALVSADLHGNGADYRSLRDQFLDRRAEGEDLHWVILGDLVHGPDERARREQPELYDFDDESFAIVEDVARLIADHSDRIHLLLGNHDHAHIGGPPVAKFYPNESAHLESTLKRAQVRLLRELFDSALLLVVAPCGVVMSHGAPSDRLTSLEPLEKLSYDWKMCTRSQRLLLESFLTSYGQMDIVARRFLERLGACLGWELGVIVHGHDRDINGVYTEGDHQICPVLFGAYDHEKRYLELDLSDHYWSVDDLQDGVEILRLHPCDENP